MTGPAGDALHHVARRYCIERASLWRRRYGELLEREAAEREAAERERAGLEEPVTYGYSPEALRTFPRYNALDAILREIERLRPDELGDLQQGRALLAAAAPRAESPFTAGVTGVEREVIDEERAAFAAFVEGVPGRELAGVEPLPFRRTLAEAEERRLREQVAAAWGVEDYWYPLDRTPDAPPPPHTVAFAAEPFFEPEVQALLRTAITGLGSRRCFQLDEEPGASVEIDVELFEPVYDLAEKLWTPADAAWLVYASHEGSLTVAGERLLASLQRAWPAWPDARS